MNIFRCLYWLNKNNVIHTLKTVSVTIGLEMCLCGDEKWNRFVKGLKYHRYGKISKNKALFRAKTLAEDVKSSLDGYV